MGTAERLLNLIDTAPMTGVEFGRLRLEIGAILGERGGDGKIVGRYGGCTQGDLAAVLNRTISNINKYENGKISIPGELATLLRLIRRVISPTRT